MDSSIIEYVYERCCSERFPLPSKSDIKKLEKRMRMPFPATYNEFLSQFNGGEFDSAVIALKKPIDARWRDGIATHVELTLEILYGIGTQTDFAELDDPWNMRFLKESAAYPLLPIGKTGANGMLLLDVVGRLAGTIFVHFYEYDDIPHVVASSIGQLLESVVIEEED